MQLRQILWWVAITTVGIVDLSVRHAYTINNLLTFKGRELLGCEWYREDGKMFLEFIKYITIVYIRL